MWITLYGKRNSQGYDQVKDLEMGKIVLDYVGRLTVITRVLTRSQKLM